LYPAPEVASSLGTRYSPVWKKLHEPVWFNPLLRAQGEAARCLLNDLLLLCDDAGSMPVPSKTAVASMCSDPDALDKLVAIEAVWIKDNRLYVASAVKDRAFSDSKKAGGDARKEALKVRRRKPASMMEPSCNHDASEMEPSRNHHPASASASTSESASTSASRMVSDFWVSRFLKVRGSKYVWQGAKDGKALSALLKGTGGDVAEIQTRIDRFLEDPFWGPKADFAKFTSQYNAMAGAKKTSDPFLEAARMMGVEQHP